MRLKRVEEIASGTLAYYFERPASFHFVAGQFVELSLKEQAPDDPYRSFSIASCPSEPDLMIATRNRDSQFKQALRSLPEGSEVQIDGPYGKLHHMPGGGLHHVFIAGGIGITPFRGIMIEVAAHPGPEPLTLFYANRELEDGAFLDELTQLTSETTVFRLVVTLTRPTPGWAGERGYIDGPMLARYVDPLEAQYYVSGPEAMVAATKMMLAGLGVPAGRVQSETFSGY